MYQTSHKKINKQCHDLDIKPTHTHHTGVINHSSACSNLWESENLIGTLPTYKTTYAVRVSVVSSSYYTNLFDPNNSKITSVHPLPE